MGGTSPRQLRAEIEKTREQLTEDLDRLAERVSPRRVAEENGPKAVGLVAFGAGLLAASMIPESPTEQRAAARLAGQAGHYAGRRHAGPMGRAMRVSAYAMPGMRGLRVLRGMRGMRGVRAMRRMRRMRRRPGLGGRHGIRGMHGVPGMHRANGMHGMHRAHGMHGLRPLRRPSRLRRLRRDARRLARHAAHRAGYRRRMGGWGA
ncbi:DUF3618 domain-containing protein [Streptomyces sp. 6N223]|uniref:DUF3618 domain-containing protein n=1 Tax=Streptomyces sp. 6N223 TaxID=3457412 RepID=UPI003FD598A4